MTTKPKRRNRRSQRQSSSPPPPTLRHRETRKFFLYMPYPLILNIVTIVIIKRVYPQNQKTLPNTIISQYLYSLFLLIFPKYFTKYCLSWKVGPLSWSQGLLEEAGRGFWSLLRHSLGFYKHSVNSNSGTDRGQRYSNIKY